MEYEDSIHSWDGEEEYYSNNICDDENRLSFIVPDKGNHSFYRMVGNKKKQISVFETPDVPNAKLRNAINGNYYTKDVEYIGRHYHYTLGSREQDFFFKVKMIDGKVKKPLVLFYNSPEEYEKHQHVVLSDAIKETWQDKYNNCR